MLMMRSSVFTKSERIRYPNEAARTGTFTKSRRKDK